MLTAATKSRVWIFTTSLPLGFFLWIYFSLSQHKHHVHFCLVKTNKKKNNFFFLDTHIYFSVCGIRWLPFQKLQLVHPKTVVSWWGRSCWGCLLSLLHPQSGSVVWSRWERHWCTELPSISTLHSREEIGAEYTYIQGCVSIKHNWSFFEDSLWNHNKRIVKSLLCIKLQHWCT